MRINTFDISILPHDDCCTLFLPSNPSTNANVTRVLSEEKKLAVEAMIQKSLEKLEVVNE
jgi:thiamine biosynthesis protein ThiI